MNVTLAGIQGSGWGWLVKDKDTKALQVIAMPVSAHIFLNIPPFIRRLAEAINELCRIKTPWWASTFRCWGLMLGSMLTSKNSHKFKKTSLLLTRNTN